VGGKSLITKDMHKSLKLLTQEINKTNSYFKNNNKVEVNLNNIKNNSNNNIIKKSKSQYQTQNIPHSNNLM